MRDSDKTPSFEEIVHSANTSGVRKRRLGPQNPHLRLRSRRKHSPSLVAATSSESPDIEAVSNDLDDDHSTSSDSGQNLILLTAGRGTDEDSVQGAIVQRLVPLIKSCADQALALAESDTEASGIDPKLRHPEADGIQSRVP